VRIRSQFLAGRDRYERVIEGHVDNTHDEAFTHTVRITDNDAGVELEALCTPSPDYEVRAARARVLAGTLDPGVADAVAALAGARMVAGFTRRLVELCGTRPGAELLVDAGVEVARLARQVTKLPSEAVAGLRPGDAVKCWELDTSGWADLPGSCFTYSAAGRALLEVRPVSTPMGPELYSPPANATKVFVRKKVARLVLTDQRLHLFHSMHDNVHGFDLHYELDLHSGTVVAADSVTSRLPYSGICNEPQTRISGMVGQPVDALLRKRIQGVLGGETGCAQLYDLTADLLKLITIEP
jgi:hypothetical protein